MSGSSSTTSSRGRSFIPLSYLLRAGSLRGFANLRPMARILIVEPHPDIRRLLEAVIRRLGHEPVIRGDGDPEAIALDAAVIEQADVAGLLVARRLRDLGVPVVLMGLHAADAEAR